jgi:hypothetical protein
MKVPSGKASAGNMTKGLEIFVDTAGGPPGGKVADSSG